MKQITKTLLARFDLRIQSENFGTGRYLLIEGCSVDMVSYN